MFYRKFERKFFKEKACFDFIQGKKELKKKSPCGNHIFLACQPKSGSTFLGNVIADITGYSWVQFRQPPIDNVNEQDIYLPALIDHYDKNTISQQHTRASNSNIEHLKFGNAKIIVLTRNIFDVIVSSFDHSENQKIVGSSMAYANDEYYKLSDDRKINMMIELGLSWHFHFYTSWYDAVLKKKADILWITYEELIGDYCGTIQKALKYCEISCEKEVILAGIEKIEKSESKARKNVGVSGRGKIALSDKQIEKIKSYTEYYPWVDFSKIGLK